MGRGKRGEAMSPLKHLKEYIYGAHLPCKFLLDDSNEITLAIHQVEETDMIFPPFKLKIFRRNGRKKF